MSRVSIRVLFVVLPLVTLLWAAVLMFTNPSDESYDCPGNAWTLLADPAKVGQAPAGFFDPGAACNEAAGNRARSATIVMMSGLVLLALGAAEAVVRRPSSVDTGAGAHR